MSKLVSIGRSDMTGISSQKVICPACGAAFEKGIELTNLSLAPRQTYLACPFCFSRLKNEPDKEVISPTFSEEPLKSPQNVEEVPSKCPHHFGYLKERPKNAPIPDECLTCKKMVQCII